MTAPVHIWTRATHHTAFRCGGWAFVRSGAELSGQAGGERNTTAPRMALAGLVAALKDLADGPLSLDLADRALAQTAAKLIAGTPFAPDEPPYDNLDLWALLTTALKGRAVTITLGPIPLGGPAAFAQAWAELAMDKAKDRGPFVAAIPRPNLAKLKLD